ncbi:C2 calcium-dependent membrane targeting [Macrophomina phaseolina MS6]|uniref:C2 calcium-dependent membrane targeting n=1 Tax=Macrophomina phaseolina (strain MS6) TaxID=1126212 RepID=K2RTU5_MACPH|nr:C2 calcium-dependent membrane targeting [Macrophomina phaseolina MS6]
MEKKLLMHDQDLAAASQRNGGSAGSTVEVEVPRSYEVKDMPLVLVVSRIFSVPYDTVQQDINAKKDVWTEKAALQDLKAYQANLSLNTRQTLSPEDFDTEDAYDLWKKAENQDLSQMMLAIIQSSPELAKSTPGALPQFKPDRGSTSADSGYSEMSRKMSEASESSYVIDQPVDMSALNLNDVPSPTEDGITPYTYIPPDPRAFYRAIVKQAFTYDLQDGSLDPTSPTEDMQAIKLLSKDSTELLSEIGLRWRIPHFSRLVLFLDVVKEKYQNQEIGLQTLDDAFTFVKQPPIENNKKGNRSSIMMLQTSMFDHTKWTIHDFVLKQQILSSMHDDLLRELYQLMLFCYDPKPPSLGPVMFVLNNHIYDDPLFTGTPEDLDEYSAKLADALAKRAAEVYSELLAKHIPDTKDEWEFFHVIELGKGVIKLCEKIQKRYRKNPEIMGVNPLNVLVHEILPSYAADARDLVAKIMEYAQQKGEELPIQDGFDLYKELVEIRRIHADALPGQPFAFHIEELLQDFVWRWIEMTNQNLVQWVENAVKQDDFQVRVDHPGQVPTDEERHSVSVVDIFRSFNQSIEQIVNLNWDDDLQYAKFMTAVSKSIGDALARYCEMTEGMFSKEMERLTPEQEAAARQTRQEKWLQMAKDTWNNKDKIEPYQFLPESLVKLNNVEYATQQLDKLEREINVDACAEVIQKHTPPANQRQKMSKYVFTIKIIEAEDIKACDMNGLSDPYVVLGDEYQKRLAKTRVVYGSLNPRWEETVDITTSGPLNIIATIWDWDTLGDHDCVGRTSLKLDPSHFRDFMPREYWLDLDTQGRLLLRVSMEGEKDDIQFYFGKAFRTLKRTERDMTRKITDKLSSYIHYCLSRRALKALLSRGVTVSSVASYFRARPQSVQQGPSQADVMSALQPLFDYFNDNFALMKETLTDSAMVMVMSRLWKEVLATLESLLVPPLSDKPSQQRPLTQQELDIVFKWLQLLFDFFHAVDEETGIASGVPLDILKSPKYHDLQNLNFFYFESTENLIRTSEAMAAASLQRQQEKAARANRLSAPAHLSGPPPGHSFGGAAGLVGMPTRKHKTVMLSRNLGTMKRAKEEKRKEAQAEPSDDIILRILRMRPEAERYLRDRSRQKERLAAAAAAEMIVKQSLMASNSRR